MEINTSCDTLYGIELESYTWVFLSSLLFMILKISWHEIFVPAAACCCLPSPATATATATAAATNLSDEIVSEKRGSEEVHNPSLGFARALSPFSTPTQNHAQKQAQEADVEAQRSSLTTTTRGGGGGRRITFSTLELALPSEEEEEQEGTDASTRTIEQRQRRNERRRKIFNEFTRAPLCDSFAIFQATSSFFFIVLAFLELDTNQSRLTQYTNFGGELANSCVANLYANFQVSFIFWLSLKHSHQDGDDELALFTFDRDRGGMPFVLFVAFFFTPALITHAVPGYILYLWIAVLFMVCWYGLNELAYKAVLCIVDSHFDKKWLAQNNMKRKIVNYLIEFTHRTFWLTLFQSGRLIEAPYFLSSTLTNEL